MALERDDAAKVLRMLLMIAQTRNAIEQEAANGGIALIAAEKAFDLAIDRAGFVSNPQVRFGQFLVVAEAALRQGDRIGLGALDPAVRLDLRASGSLRLGAMALIDMLLVRYRDPDRALAVVAKVKGNEDDHLHSAILEVMPSDSAFAISLAERMKDRHARFRALLAAADAMATTQPALARGLLDKALGERSGTERYGAAIQ